MVDWKALGATLGTALARCMPAGVAKALREHYASKYSRCRRCTSPLAGPSPEQICEACHADEALAQTLGGSNAPEA